jgi:hypothetical protein
VREKKGVQKKNKHTHTEREVVVLGGSRRFLGLVEGGGGRRGKGREKAKTHTPSDTGLAGLTEAKRRKKQKEETSKLLLCGWVFEFSFCVCDISPFHSFTL